MTVAADISRALRVVETGGRIEAAEALALAGFGDVSGLTMLAEQVCLAGHGMHVSFSKKVFIPLTKLCRDVCHYCTFAQRAAPR